jgi:hypothetical protein
MKAPATGFWRERTISRKEEKKTGHLAGIAQPDLFETLGGIDKCT